MNGWHIEQGTAILFGMCMAIIALVCVLAYLADDLIRTKAELGDEKMEFEADLRQAIMRDVGRIFVAERLREIARNYESPDNVRLRREIGRTTWKEGGTPLPALWMLALADGICPEPAPNAIIGRDELDRPIRAGDPT